MGFCIVQAHSRHMTEACLHCNNVERRTHAWHEPAICFNWTPCARPYY